MTAVEELLDFIAARLDDAERAARAATPGTWEGDGGDGYVYTRHPANEVTPYRTGTEDIAHIVLHQPAAVLRDVEATRRLLGHLKATCLSWCDAGDHVAKEVAQIIASRWSDHPAYRPEWAVED